MTETTPALHYLSQDTFLADVASVADQVRASGWAPDFVVGIGRGGLVPAVYLSHRLDLPMLSIDHSSKVPGFAEELLGKVAEKSARGERLLFVDDINDSGGTIARVRALLAEAGCHDDNLRFAVLISNVASQVSVDFHSETIDRTGDKRWFVFPWEAVGTTEAIVADANEVPSRIG